MKRLCFLCCAFILCISLFACNKQSEFDSTSQTDGNDNKAVEQSLSPEEQTLVDCILKIADEEIEKPMSLKVMSVGDYQHNSEYEESDILYGPDNIIVRTIDDEGQKYFKICITTATAYDSNDLIESLQKGIDLSRQMIGASAMLGEDTTYQEQSLNEDIAYLMRYTAKKGDYVELFNYTIESNSNQFNIDRINNAINKHWQDKGLK
ncbi:MAG: hypothetical protein IKK83_06655 [Clostridia bacterium]|nr:hypothetical protein [Clostridia bacterium]